MILIPEHIVKQMAMMESRVTTVYFTDEWRATLRIEGSKRIIEAATGLCIYDDDTLTDNVLYPWHKIEKLVRHYPDKEHQTHEQP